jgi:hypothetical protein
MRLLKDEKIDLNTCTVGDSEAFLQSGLAERRYSMVFPSIRKEIIAICPNYEVERKSGRVGKDSIGALVNASVEAG